MKMSEAREEILTNGIQTMWPQLHALSLLQAAFKKPQEHSWLLEAGQPILRKVTLLGSRDTDILLKYLVLSPVGPSALGALRQLSSPAKDLVQKAKLVNSFQPREKKKITHPCPSLVLVQGAPTDHLVGAHSAPPTLLFPLRAHTRVCACVIAHLCTQICDLHIPVTMHFLPPIEGPVQILIKAGSPPAWPPRQEFLFLLNFVFRSDPRIHFNFKPVSLRSHKEGSEQLSSMGYGIRIAS